MQRGSARCRRLSSARRAGYHPPYVVADAPGSSEQARASGSLLVATWLLVGLGVALLAILTQQVERTPDELNYQLSGRRLVAGAPPDRLEDRFQGPLIFLATQLTDDGGKLTDDDTLRRARLGMLVFPALLLVVLAFWTRAALGERSGCLVAALAALNPSLLAYGPLLSSDVAFTATALSAGWSAWWWLQRPGLARLALLGVAVGALVATKYTAALTVFGLAAVLLGHVALGFDPWPKRGGEPRSLRSRAGAAVAALAIVAAVALGVLYACYLFTVAPLSAAALAELESGTMRALRGLPGGGLLLRLLPETLVVGVDFQAQWAGTTATGTFGELRGTHWAYYPVTLLYKVPVSIWSLGALAVLTGRAAGGGRGLWTTALVPAALLLAYCSATRALQMGVRYVLPAVPAMLMLAAAFAGRRPWGKLTRLVVAAALATSLWQVAVGWPHFVGYFNALSGGPAAGYRVVADGNCAWGQERESGRAALAARHPELTFLPPASGPRFGRVAAWWQDLKAVDPRDGERTYHWLSRFEPLDHAGAAWLAYEVAAVDFERAAAAGDARAAVDLALAWLRERRYDEARRALTLVEPADEEAARTAALIEASAAADRDASGRDALAVALSEAGHFDLALARIDRSRRQNAVLVYWLLWRAGRQQAAVEHLDQAGADGSRTTEEVGLLAMSLYNGADQYPPDPERALEYMQQHIELGKAPGPDDPARASWDGLMAQVRGAVARERRLEGLR